MAHLVEFGGKQCPMFVISLAHPQRNEALEYAQTQTSFLLQRKYAINNGMYVGICLSNIPWLGDFLANDSPSIEWSVGFITYSIYI